MKSRAFFRGQISNRLYNDDEVDRAHPAKSFASRNMKGWDTYRNPNGWDSRITFEWTRVVLLTVDYVPNGL